VSQSETMEEKENWGTLLTCNISGVGRSARASEWD